MMVFLMSAALQVGAGLIGTKVKTNEAQARPVWVAGAEYSYSPDPHWSQMVKFAICAEISLLRLPSGGTHPCSEAEYAGRKLINRNEIERVLDNIRICEAGAKCLENYRALAKGLAAGLKVRFEDRVPEGFSSNFGGLSKYKEAYDKCYDKYAQFRFCCYEREAQYKC